MKFYRGAKKGLVFGMALMAMISSAAMAREVGTADGNGPDKVFACKQAKEDAQREARNNKSVITGYGSCECRESKTASNRWYCTVDFSMEKK